MAIAAGLAACGVAEGPSGVASQPPASQPAASAAIPTTTPSGATTSAPAPGGALVVDPTLLRILPASVAGVAMQASPESSAAMIADPSLAQSASAIAVGVVAAGASGGDDLAVSSVIQLRPGVFSDAFYQGWRAAYDDAACARAGGISSHIEQLNGLHKVEVTVCAQGARTYHTHLAGDILVSITSVGDRKFGDLVMNGLRG